MLDAIRQARAHALDVTAETSPYVAGASQIESALFDDWESYPDAQFQRYLWPATGERLTRATLANYRKTGGLVITFGNIRNR